MSLKTMTQPTAKELHQAHLLASFGASEAQILEVLAVEMTPELLSEITEGAKLSSGKSLYHRATEDRDVDAAIEFERERNPQWRNL